MLLLLSDVFNKINGSYGQVVDWNRLNRQTIRIFTSIIDTDTDWLFVLTIIDPVCGKYIIIYNYRWFAVVYCTYTTT